MFSAATEMHYKTSGSDGLGTQQEENLAANRSERSLPSCKFQGTLSAFHVSREKLSAFPYSFRYFWIPRRVVR